MPKNNTRRLPRSGERLRGDRPLSPDAATAAPPKTRLTVAVILFLTAIACPFAAAAVITSDAPARWKTAAGLLVFPIPEMFDFSAIAILGKPGFAYLKSRAGAWFRKHGPPATVGRTRYRIGIVMFVLPLFFGWINPYVANYIPEYNTHRVAVNLAGDVLFLASFFVLGGDFWDKVRALFLNRATARIPSADE